MSGKSIDDKTLWDNTTEDTEKVAYFDKPDPKVMLCESVSIADLAIHYLKTVKLDPKRYEDFIQTCYEEECFSDAHDEAHYQFKYHFPKQYKKYKDEA